MNRLEIVEQMRNCRDFKISGLRKVMKVIERDKGYILMKSCQLFLTYDAFGILCSFKSLLKFNAWDA